MRFVFIIFLFAPLLSPAQKIVENKIDDFTKSKVIRTNWETFLIAKQLSGYVRCSQIDERLFLEFKIMLGGGAPVFSVKEGESLMLKLNTDSIVSLSIPKSEVSCKGCGAIGLIGSAAHGMHLEFFLTKTTIETLTQNSIVKLRFYTRDGYAESEIKEKNRDLIARLLKLITTSKIP